MDAEKITAMSPCERCGWPVDQPLEIVSRHPTTAGMIIYARCVCGLLRVWLRPHGPRGLGRHRLVAQGAHPASKGA